MKKPILIFVIIIIVNTVIAQTDNDSTSFAKNTIYVELLGNGGLYSINFDRIIHQKKKFNISLRGGLSITPFSIGIEGISGFFSSSFGTIDMSIPKKSLLIPVEVNYLFGKRHYFEMGSGLTYITGGNLSGYGTRLVLFVSPLGYRFQKPNGGFFFKARMVSFLKIIDYKKEFLFNSNRYALFWLGISFGYTMKKKKP